MAQKMAQEIKIAVHSLGEMGVGVARCLTAGGYTVFANVEGRSQHTRDRAEAAQVELVSTFADLLAKTDIFLSIVPPAHALATAQAVSQGLDAAPSRQRPLCFIDLNAISPRQARSIQAQFGSRYPFLTVLDGGIIGAPPHEENGAWKLPSLIVSGPQSLDDMLGTSHLADTLNVKHIGPEIGAASGLKMCFASLTKGFTALAIQSFTTASQLGVLGELREHLSAYAPALGGTAERSLVGMPPKAYRWAREMEEIGETMRDDGGFAGRGEVSANQKSSMQKGDGGNLFDSIAEVYEFIAERTDLGKEHVSERKLGKDCEEVARICASSLKPEHSP